MRCIYIVCLLLLPAAGVRAQSYQYYLPKPAPVDSGKFYLRASFLGLIDLFDGHASIGAEKRLTRRLSATLDAGYIFYTALYYAKSSASGILLRPGIRWYSDKHKNLHYELQFHYKDVWYTVNDWLGKDLVNDTATYFQKQVWQARKRVYGGQIIIGNKVNLSERWSTEIYWGLGIHYKEEWLPNEEPNNGYVVKPNMLVRQSVYASRKNTQVLPAMQFGFRWVYSIR